MRPHARPWLFALAGAVISLAVAVLPTVPAAAAEVAKDALAVDAQTFVVPADASPPDPERPNGWSVTVESVVQWPSSDHDVTPGVGTFGWRSCRGCTADHHGVDFNPGYGTPVAVVADGYVLSAGPSGALGWAVTVRHSIDGVVTDTVYGHMIAGSLLVRPGAEVHGGDIVGLVGSTGLSTGPHLHFEVHVDGVLVDPYGWLLVHENAEDWSWLKPVG